MSLLDTLHKDMVAALKAGKSESVSTLRMAISSLKSAAIDAQGTLDEMTEVSVVKKEIRKLTDVLSDFVKAGRDDLRAKTEEEIALLQSYMPAELSDAELSIKVHALLGTFSKDMPFGARMSAVMKELKGQADGARIRAIVEEAMKP